MNLSLIGYGVAALAVIGLLTGLYYHGKHVESLEGQVTTAKVISDIRKKQDEILVNPTDFDTLLKRLWNGST